MLETITRFLLAGTFRTGTVGTIAAISAVGLLPRQTFVAGAASEALATAPTVSHYRAADTSDMPIETNAPSESVAPSTRATMGLPNIEHPLVDSWIKRFTTDMRGSYATYLSRKSTYEGMISDKLAERGMPQGLIYLAMIESGFNPKAKSPVSASGLWQFMGATGREYGLVVNGKVDERNNPARSTDAALKYLDRLYNRFGSWYLAAAAYNTGQGRVAKVLKQETGKTRGTDADYYRISHRLPRETRDYVPKMIAAARIGTNPGQYGFRD
jgi:membrane-bound lytic murein transglycosylase D